MSATSVYQVCRPATRKHLVEQRAVHALDEPVRARGADAGRAVLDAFYGQQQLDRVLVGAPAELPAVVGEERGDGHAQRLVERQHAIVEQVTRADRHLVQIDLREGQRAEHVDHDLHVDRATPFSVPQ